MGERIIDIVKRGTELEFMLRRGVGQAEHTCNNPHVKGTGVYVAQTINKADTMNCNGFNSRDLGSLH
jgi:hypothetical protein